MEDFLKKVINGVGIKPPGVCRLAFSNHFPGAVNPEWFLGSGKYEVLFHRDSVEYIAIFDTEGKLDLYKVYLAKDLLPSAIRSLLEKDWEIMNVVLINHGNQITYEVIVRNEKLNRYLVMVDQLGKVIEERVL